VGCPVLALEVLSKIPKVTKKKKKKKKKKSRSSSTLSSAQTLENGGVEWGGGAGGGGGGAGGGGGLDWSQPLVQLEDEELKLDWEQDKEEEEEEDGLTMKKPDTRADGGPEGGGDPDLQRDDSQVETTPRLEQHAHSIRSPHGNHLVQR